MRRLTKGQQRALLHIDVAMGLARNVKASPGRVVEEQLVAQGLQDGAVVCAGPGPVPHLQLNVVQHLRFPLPHGASL